MSRLIQVERHKFALVVKTMSTCPVCIALSRHKESIKAILPANITFEEIVMNASVSKKRRMFMYSRGGHIVPSAFLLTLDKWNISSKCNKKRRTDRGVPDN